MKLISTIILLCLDGTYLKRLDTKKINDLGWHAKISLDEGIKKH